MNLTSTTWARNTANPIAMGAVFRCPCAKLFLSTAVSDTVKHGRILPKSSKKNSSPEFNGLFKALLPRERKGEISALLPRERKGEISQRSVLSTRCNPKVQPIKIPKFGSSWGVQGDQIASPVGCCNHRLRETLLCGCSIGSCTTFAVTILAEQLIRPLFILDTKRRLIATVSKTMNAFVILQNYSSKLMC